MRPDDLVLFVRVVDDGSFSATARRMGIPRSSVSKRIGVLEADLGLRLIHRTTRRFVLTEAGEHFHRHAAAAVLEMDAAREAVEGLRSEPVGQVVVSASPATLSLGLSDILIEIAAGLPRVRLKSRADNRFVDFAADGVDIAIRAHREALPDSDTLCVRLGEVCNVLVAAPAYARSFGLPAHPDDLANHHCIVADSSGDSPRWRLSRDGDENAYGLGVRMTMDDPVHVHRAAEAGLGIANLPLTLCTDAIQNGRLVILLDDWDAGRVTLSLLAPYRRGRLPSIGAVIEGIAERMARRLASADTDDRQLPHSTKYQPNG